MKKERRNLPFCLIAGCAAILSAPTINGQQYDTTKVAILNEVVVTATRSEKNLNDIGRSITVITSNDIRNSGAITVSDLLNRAEGFYIVGAQQNPGSLSSISTRGANNSHTVIMVDGIRISDPSSTDNSIDLSELSVANIERIEVIRGSHSTLYGSSAIGGTVNIITKKNNQTPGIHVDADMQGGAFCKNGSIASENLLLNYTHINGFYLNAEIFNSASRGFNSTVDTITNPDTYKHPDMGDGFQKTDLIGKIGYKTSKLDLYAAYKRINQDLDIDYGAFNDDENYTTNFKRNLFTYGGSYKLNEEFSLRYIGGMSDLVRTAINDSSQIDAAGNTDKSYFRGKYSGSLTDNELQVNYNVKGLQLVVGSSAYKETMSAKTYYFSDQWGVYESESDLDSLDINTTTSSVFFHADLNGELFDESLKPFSFGLGARLLKHSTFGPALTYEINPSVKLNKNSLLYFSFSTGFNAPSLYQLYSPEKDFNSGIARGNNTLKPEESSSWEIGIKQKANNNMWWSVSYFETVVNNIIDYVYLWNKNQAISSLSYLDYSGDTYINLGKQTNRGIEFSINSKISDKLIISGNFSLVNGKLEYNPDNIDNSRTQGNHIQLYSNGKFILKETESVGLARRPNTGNINLTYLPSNKITLRMDIKYVGSRNDVGYDASLGPYGALGTIGVEDYALLDFQARYEILKGFSATLHVENILNTDYSEIIGYSTRGRGLYCGLSYSF
jgi:vitamin B12 transporter